MTTRSPRSAIVLSDDANTTLIFGRKKKWAKERAVDAIAERELGVAKSLQELRRKIWILPPKRAAAAHANVRQHQPKTPPKYTRRRSLFAFCSGRFSGGSGFGCATGGLTCGSRGRSSDARRSFWSADETVRRAEPEHLFPARPGIRDIAVERAIDHECAICSTTCSK